MSPEESADAVFDGLTEPPGMWSWHADQSDDWNRRAEARWEERVGEMMGHLSVLDEWSDLRGEANRAVLGDTP